MDTAPPIDLLRNSADFGTPRGIRRNMRAGTVRGNKQVFRLISTNRLEDAERRLRTIENQKQYRRLHDAPFPKQAKNFDIFARSLIAQ